MNAHARDIIDYLLSYYEAEEWPTLLAQAEEWAQTQPLKGLKVLDATPLFRNTLAKFAPLLAAGVELYVPTNTTMPYDPVIRELVGQFGIRKATKKDNPHDIVLDCAGQFTRLLPTLGFCELTGTGVVRYRHAPRRPVLLADAGRIKQLETTLGTGESFFRAMDSLGYSDVAGRRLLVIGYGKVGRGVVFYARQRGMKVTVADCVDKQGELPPDVDFVHVDDQEAFHAAALSVWCIVAATGKISALKHKLPASKINESSVLLANLGVEDEFGPYIPESRVLNHKRPVNFILEEPTRMRYIETTMALHNACGLELLTPDLPHACLPPSRDVEDRLLAIALEKGRIREEVERVRAELFTDAADA